MSTAEENYQKLHDKFHVDMHDLVKLEKRSGRLTESKWVVSISLEWKILNRDVIAKVGSQEWHCEVLYPNL